MTTDPDPPNRINEATTDRGPAKPANGVPTDSGSAKPPDEATTHPGLQDLLNEATTAYPKNSRSVSACEPYREVIELGLNRGRNAMAIWQDLVSQHGFDRAIKASVS